MHESQIKVSDLNTIEDKEKIISRLSEMIGVIDVQVDESAQLISLRYDTPMNLNTLEKEVYDAGFPVIDSFEGGH
ncbi:putative copper chaperone CsoZ [Staphylococcus canis]|uniref:Heavy-metal-associated domain-containing protein n=1 Tax=Staphylococcus canis TaxID=2724942 RepID=A0ABS0TC10_9STAP|nr:heavy-metal-associated domain-containing protein [Staphylococcus canis]MBI5975501.1 heavy-metal-associated domain-containing protein [Staphylococcus canis]